MAGMKSKAALEELEAGTEVEQLTDEEREDNARRKGFRIFGTNGEWRDTLWVKPGWFVFRAADEAPITGPFKTKAEALDSMPHVLRLAAALEEAKRHGYDDFYCRATRKWSLDAIGGMGKSAVAGAGKGPFETQEEALAVVPRLIREQEQRDKETATHLMRVRLERTNIPEAYRGAKVSDFAGDSAQFAEAVEVARVFTSFSLSLLKSPRNAVFVGPAGTGKTRLGCALAEELARGGLDVFYASVMDLREADKNPGLMNELQGAPFLVLDWDGIETRVEDKVLRYMVKQFAIDTVPILTEFLETRSHSFSTLFIADCELEYLQKLMGPSYDEAARQHIAEFSVPPLTPFEKLKKHARNIVEFHHAG
ncbi:MAG TPA: ATP-binding protein [Terriglobales bacterium]|nr:ATP-binding protein [Terriglobales bacterium]